MPSQEDIMQEDNSPSDHVKNYANVKECSYTRTQRVADGTMKGRQNESNQAQTVDVRSTLHHVLGQDDYEGAATSNSQ
eukprot:CAMPEP_0170588724 /NCGR_PEP_ID=MMETSP0224-20130122/10984_1 /TAXON_ID=285029 /ORGANISM="Togula jolla, Strain CCCM 725" /LENGTH=77 /DNA_ID=CAMNT_0010912463 /DNA_START=392 /DNA_END=625 /DNA_ORIENTATION=-